MPSRRRGNGEGSIFQEKSGRWRISVTRWEGTKRIRKTRIAWKKADAVAILKELRGDETLPNGHLTVGSYLKKWLADVVASMSANTLNSYTMAVDNHIASRLGTIRLDRLSPIHVQSWIAAMVKDEVGDRSQQNAFAVLRSALKKAVGLNLIAKNPCDRISKPKCEAEPINPFTLIEAREILEDSVGTRWHVAYQLAFTAGLRQGEIFGLRWDRIDFKMRELKVDQQVICIGGKTSLAKPKTKSSIRSIELTLACIESLKAHRAILFAEGNAANFLVLPAPEGGLIGRSTFRSRVWVPQIKSLLLKERGFHHTRHTYATLALGAGVPVTVVSKNLGHSKVSTTLDIYSHVLQTHRSAATETISRLFG